MVRNCTIATEVDKINTLLAAAVDDMKKWMVWQWAFISVFIRNFFFDIPKLPQFI